MTIKPLVAAALALGSVAVAPVQAQRYGYAPTTPGYDQPYRGEGGGGWSPEYRRDDYYPAGRGDDGQRGYDRRGYDPRVYQQGYDQRRYDERVYRRCSNGTTGTILGALAGGLLGRAIDNRGDRAVGTVLGAGAGALAGHAVEKSNNPGYCR